MDLVDENGTTPLHLACMKAKYNIVVLLINIWANPNALNSKLFTPFDYALHTGSIDLVDKLIKKWC